MQKRCIRTITFSYKLEHTAPLFNQLNVLSFKKLVIQRIALMMHKQSVGLLPCSLNDIFTKNKGVHNHNTRQRDNLHLPIGRGEAIYKTFSFHGIQIWNYMSAHVPIDVSYACFKKFQNFIY